MFLATTALSELWENDQEIIFLGHWCIKYSKNNNYGHIKNNILINPVDNKKIRERSYNYCVETYKKIIKILSQELNYINGVNEDEEYWKIIIGDWLFRYIQIVYERYLCLQHAYNEYPELYTNIIGTKDYLYVKDNEEFLNLCTSDYYNLQLYSQIIDWLGLEAKQVHHISKNNTKRYLNKKKKFLKNTIKSLKFFLLYKTNILFNKNSDIFILENDIKNIIGNKLLKDKKVTKFIQPQFICKSKNKINKEDRIRFKKKISEDRFHNLIFNMLEFCLPMDFAENFRSIYDHCNKYSKKINGKLILCGPAWRFNTYIGVFLAEKKIKLKSKIIVVQHGGGYGILKNDPLFMMELEISDYFITWGWDQKNKEKLLPLPVPLISCINKQFHSWSNDFILFPNNLKPRYARSLGSTTEGNQIMDQINRKIDFLHQVDDCIIPNIYIKPYFYDYGWALDDRIKDEFENIKYCSSSNIFKLIRQAKLLLSDANQTSYLYSIGLNLPTIIFWDKNVWLTHDSAKKIFDGLEDVGVFHSSPTSAAQHLNQIYDNIDEWWSQTIVQKAVNEFRGRYVLTDNNYKKLWNNKLTELIN